MRSAPRQGLRRAAAGTFVAAGALHFVKPRVYESIMPDYLPRHRELVYASGLAEAAGGAGLVREETRRYAGWLLIATMVGVFPANVHMALHPERYPGVPGGQAGLLARLPFQAVFIAWIWAAMQDD